MRTKTLLIAAAALAVGVGSSMAQTYSQNIVGYVNTPLPTGYTLLVAPLSPNTTNNAEAILPALASGDILLVWNGGGYNVDYFNGPGDWYDGVSFNPISQPVLLPGVGFFYQNGGSLKTNTFVGTVQLTNTIALVTGYSLVGSTAPIGGSIESTNFNIPFASGDIVLVWNGGGYNVDYFNGPADWYDGVTFNPIAVPTLSLSQGFFYQNGGGAKNWIENVIVP
jgi:hypothetical protein